MASSEARWLLQKPADLDLWCFQKRINPDSAEQGLNMDSLLGLKSVCFLISWLLQKPAPE